MKNNLLKVSNIFSTKTLNIGEGFLSALLICLFFLINAHYICGMGGFWYPDTTGWYPIETGGPTGGPWGRPPPFSHALAIAAS